jgi:hypothetical protein
MPLLNVVGIASCNTTYFSCLAFLSQETENDYVWVLGCLAQIVDD